MALDTWVEEEWDDLIDRLAGYGVHYLASDCESETTRHSAAESGAGEEIEGGNGDTGNLVALGLALAQSRHAHLRDALVSLSLRHPSAAGAALVAAGSLPAGDPVRRLLLVSVVVAAALQREWAFTLEIYLPEHLAIDAEDLASELELPSPSEDYGRPCLIAASDALARDAPFPFNYRSGWEEAAHRLLAQLRQDARRRG